MSCNLHESIRDLMVVDGEIGLTFLEFLMRPMLTDEKLLLLRKLNSEVSRDYISESAFDALEKLEQIEFVRAHGNKISDVLKRAYSLAAVDCTLRVLRNGDGEVGDWRRKFSFLEMVKRVWRGDSMNRILGKSGWGSDLLQGWKNDIEAVVGADDGDYAYERERVLQKFEGVRAIDAVRDYLRDESERLVSEGVHSDSGLQTAAEVESHQPRVEAPNVGKEKFILRNKLLGVTRYDAPGNAEFKRTRKALEISSMERNPTAQSSDWDDSVGVSPENITCTAELRLPSPKKIKTSPLKVCEPKEIKMRRIPRRWRPEEEKALKEGVKKLGKGSWKLIQQSYLGIFQNRTEVDLKDKWRNLEKSGRISL